MPAASGGLAVFDQPLGRGRWYWEVSIVSQAAHPIFVGVASSPLDLNDLTPTEERGLRCGVWLHDSNLCSSTEDVAAPVGRSVRLDKGATVGLLLDCDDRLLGIYADCRRIASVPLDLLELSPCAMYVAIGLRDAEVYLNLTAPVPEKLWAASAAFRFPTPVVSGCLTASPLDGAYISWDAKARGRQLRLSADSTTVIAGDCRSSDDSIESVVATHAMESDNAALFAEVHVLSPGRDGVVRLAFGLVGTDFSALDDCIPSAVDVTLHWPEDALDWSIFGVLFDVAKAKVTVYPSAGEPQSAALDIAALKRPLLPAVSALCNGVVFATNFHPRVRPELPLHAMRPGGVSDNANVTSSSDIQVGKLLQMQVRLCDGGEFSASHAARNCLLDDTSVFSSAKGANVNLVLRHELDTPFCLSYLVLRGPGPGYSSPLRHAAVFVTSSMPDLRRLQAFDNLTPEEFACLPFGVPSPRSDRDELLPVAFCVLDGSCAQNAKQLAVPVVGRYVVVKLLCPTAGSNIDVGYIGLYGTFDKDNGPAYADSNVVVASCEECKATPLRGVFYVPRDDDASRLCAACYDDNRGRLDTCYVAHTGEHEQAATLSAASGEATSTLCMPRKAWLDKVATQLGALRRHKPLGALSTVEGGNGALAALPARDAKATERSSVWFDDCELFSCGQNNYGELCLGHCNSTSKLEHVPFFSGKSIRDIAGGNEVLAVLARDGTLFTCGLNKSGQCGNGTFEERVLVASPVRALAGIPIEMIAAANGCEHMLAVATDGAVYSWGYNDRGQLGLGSTISKSHTPRLVESLRDKYVVTSAAVSYHHSAVITSAGELLTFGMNDCGQLGLDHTQHQHTPQLVDALSSQVVTKVACGLYHTVVTTAGGELYAFGKNDYGQLGLGHARNVKLPTLVRVTIGDSDEKVVDVSCGYYHTVAVTDKGKLLTWGRNDYGQLGIGSKDHKNVPQYVPLPLSSRIRKASCGCYHTLILLANGRVMVFGRNNKGQLGAGARTLPSADLPLPIPSNSLSSDEVVCVAAGFYSSYILTGRSSQSRDAEHSSDDAAAAKDLPEHSTSEALYESLMKEIDRAQHVDLPAKPAPLQLKRTSIYRKLPLLKLHAAAWAMARALLYQSLQRGGGSEGSTGSKKRPSVQRALVDFLLGNLREMQGELGKDVEPALQLVASRVDACATLKQACVGLLSFCAARPSVTGVPDTALNALQPHFFRNQVLWVLLACGSVDAEVAAMLAASSDVVTEIIKGILSPDLSSATICVRLAMLVFPLHSVAGVNATYRKLQGPAAAPASDLLTMLMQLVGHPLVHRPRLCSHELGIERSCTVLCASAQCVKGLTASDDGNGARLHEQVLERSHVAAAKAAEVVALLRLLTLSPQWKVAVNASLTRAFTRAEQLGDLLDTICRYYVSVETPEESTVAPTAPSVTGPSESDDRQLNNAGATGVRKPETTGGSGSPEVDDAGTTDAGSPEKQDGDAAASASERDKKALQVWQKARDALDSLSAVLAAVSVVGGHVEVLREGAYVALDDGEHKPRSSMGFVSGLKRDTRGETVASVLVLRAESPSRSPIGSPASVVTVPVKQLRAMERVPPLLAMFDNLEGVLSALALMILPSTDVEGLHAELAQPQNHAVQTVLGTRMRSYKKQLQWRATKALSALLKQMPSLSPQLANTDSQLLSNVAQTIASEHAARNNATLAALKADDALPVSVLVDQLQSRWHGVQRRQILLDTERVINASLDLLERDARDRVVRRLGQENALSWGLDAIQSPRKNSTPSAFGGAKGGTSVGHGGRLARSRLDGDGARTAGAAGDALPPGTWGVLLPLPQLNENDNGGGTGAPQAHHAIDFTPFHLTSPIVRVGRAADSCDLIVNDRSVSGRHFHLRRVRRDHDVPEEFFELQDFSKNGTIVNGVRVHGTSIRLTPGSRISLILSRGGLVTYEFQVRASAAAVANTLHHSHRVPPPPIITSAAASQADPATATAVGQEYQQPMHPLAAVEPRSPAEIQNRGNRVQSSDSRLDGLRSRVAGGAQGLRLITSIAESEVPRALISPNPAVESPRVGGFSSPRSSVLQAPGTPVVTGPIPHLFSTMVPPSGVLSPASYQQHESSGGNDAAPTLLPGRTPVDGVSSDALRIALGRESVHREASAVGAGPAVVHRLSAGAELSRTTKTFSDLHQNAPSSELQSQVDEVARRVLAVGLQATTAQCHEALELMQGDINAAFLVLQEQLTAEAGNVAAAIRLLLSPAGAELERVSRGPLTASLGGRDGTCPGDASDNSPEAMLNLHEIMDENQSYALAETSAVQQGPRGRPSSPAKQSKQPEATATAKSQLALWADWLSSIDERTQSLGAAEIDEEDASLSDVLTAIHARKLLKQIVRLFSDVPDQADNMLAAFGDPMTLRHLIVFPSQSPTTAPPDELASDFRVDEDKAPQLLARMMDRSFENAAATTMQEKLHALQTLGTLVFSMDRSNEPFSTETCRLSRLLRVLVMYERQALSDDGSGLLHQTSILHNLLVDTLLHALSRAYVHPGALSNWDAKGRRAELLHPKGPLRLSCGLEAVVVSSYDRVWSVPSPDPVLVYRHKWRKRAGSASASAVPSTKLSAAPGSTTGDHTVTLWRPVIPAGMKLLSSKGWFALGDTMNAGYDAPDAPVLLLHDDGSGLLLAPVGFERVDVTGKGLPTNSENDPDFQRKQLRSLWWPIAPPGYVALGCVAGRKDDPFEPPALSSVRCLREDLVQRVDAYRCLWRAESCSVGPPTLLKALDHHLGERRNQQSDGGGPRADRASPPPASSSLLELATNEVRVQTSLWTVDTEYCASILPVISVGASGADDVATAYTVNLSVEDRTLCSSVSVASVLSFVDALLQCQQFLGDHDVQPNNAAADSSTAHVAVRPELTAAVFALVKTVLRERQPGAGPMAMRLVRTLIALIRRGGQWKDLRGVLFCRSKIMALQQDQEGGLMLNGLLQAFVELLLVVDEQNRAERVAELTSCLDRDAKSTINLPYRFHFARDAHREMLVSHSSKMAVTRHFSGEERKFLLDVHGSQSHEDAAAATPSVLSEHVSCRFEHTPVLVMALKDAVKAKIVYFEVSVTEWNSSAAGGANGNADAGGATPLLSLGFSAPEFPLEGPAIGFNTTGAASYSFTPGNGKVQTSDVAADQWQWGDQLASLAIGDVIGCGLRVDTSEVFFTKNGQLLGTAFSSVQPTANLHPTISVNADSKLLINFGSSGAIGESFTSKVHHFAFRFHAMDYDNVMSGFDWYEPLSQVYGVMRALMDPAREAPDTAAPRDAGVAAGALPDEFMLSADNFLSEISEDVCIHVESAHPYDLELQESVVSIPLATSIRVKLDTQCETANSHCLQILQGGDSSDGAGGVGAVGGVGVSSESEVRAFTGACGGQEVMIEGDSFVWRFPVQSNFQCRVDRVRKGPYLKLEHRDTRLSLTRDKGWQTAIGVARFDSGVHIWEVRINFVTASSNIFLGIARRDVRLDSYLGKDNRGWGWIGNRALWHNGSKQRGTYGEKFKTGDIVRMTLDLKRGTLSYALNGKDLGVAFGPGGVGPKLEGTFYPGFALYNQRDSIDLIGGHRVEDGDALPLGSGSFAGASGDELYYSEDEDDAAADVDEGIPNFRMELATALSQMGFPMDWCVYALRHCEDDAEQAADFILANMHVMEALVREEAEAHSRRIRHREAHAAATGSSSLAPPPAPVLGEFPVDDALGAELSPTRLAEEPPPSPSDGAPATQSVDKWGIAFTAVPEFSVTGRRLLAAKYSGKLQQLHASQCVFTPAHDNAIVEIVNEICEARAEALLSCDPLRMGPEEFVPTDEHLRRHPCLQGLPLGQVQKRFLILRNFNCRLQNSLSFIDFSVRDDDQSLLAEGARRLRGVIFQHVKLAWWLNILKEQQSPAAARPEIEVDRHRARDATERTGIKDSVFAQCFDQLQAIQPSLLRGADRAFKCQFVGEFGDDFGGLYRECLAQISSELQSKALPLLKPCPNAVLQVGENREQFVPNVHLRDEDARLVPMAEFFGKLVGIAIRTKTPLDLNLPRVVWKAVVRQPVRRQDVEAIHHGCFQVVDTIHNIDRHGINEAMFDEIVDASFTVLSSARQEVELVPGGRNIRVAWEDKDAYARAVETYRLTEFRGVCDDIRRGIATILPIATLGLFTASEFATLVCGKPTVDVDLLRRRTIYGDGCQASDPHIAFFWDVLSEFSDEQKSSFLRFVWGRSRLPTHAADFTQDFKISGLPRAAGRPDAYLPIAHTCFFSIDLPSYSSRDVMREKLLYAITHCQSIDADNTTVAQRAGQGLNWTATTTTPGATMAIATATATASTAVATAAAAVTSVIAGISASLSSES
ncbi:hypothetical protein P43SY_009330 [Pythium insidiosum]|uniref:FHA domain-containing protein n=1 Tax=Pythium insidiosum TaxID=114742 RepID=A0AAD5Q448_PYTIN|nr:hypothetical protein P43SY_009330 [Pythium insidiosum]